MDEEQLQKLSSLIITLDGLTTILQVYCENYMEQSNEMSALVELSIILNKKAQELCNLF